MDLVPHAQGDGQMLLSPSPGGAPGNVAAGLGLLGKRPLMLAKVGDEAFGQAIIAALNDYGVDTSGIVRDGSTKTRLSVVTLGPQGERSFIFYKDCPADEAVDATDIDPGFITSSRILHVGSLLMASPRSAAAQEKAITLARASGTPVSADPNLRPGLWPDHDTMIAAGRRLVAQANIVKLSAEELEMLGREGGVQSLWHDGLKLMAITHGAEGAELFTTRHRIICHGYRVEAIDTLACGDAFMAALLAGLLDNGFETEDENTLRIILRRACAAGALAATRKGAMSSLPTASEIDQLLAAVPENRSQAP